ncbi:hypothetical protein B0I35DRAFT_437559 [Stachybotrys elegans]|uniref:Hydrophobin n=1 Tax=Stachybotrys elegans TaxID=80388 RepID=A0A8K0SSI6_9HYPO|nr:hypothetical protein B0I35DRAFT_437559 [Stachybotrys elegans]
MVHILVATVQALGIIPIAMASPMTQVTRQAATCPDWGRNIGGALILAPRDSEASLCCAYGTSLAQCCRNKPFDDDPYWARALECSSPYYASSTAFSPFYVCNVDPCREGCEGIPYVYEERPGCQA